MGIDNVISRLGARLRIPIVAGLVSLQAAACAVRTAPPISIRVTSRCCAIPAG